MTLLLPSTPALLVGLAAMLIGNASPLLAGGSKEDYERALSLSKRTEGKVFHLPLNGAWKPDGTHFSYRVQTAPNVYEEVLINAESGTREVQSKPRSTRPIETHLRKDIPPKTLRNGVASSISFVNQTSDEIEIFWMDQKGARHSYAKVAAKGSYSMSTFAGHVWLVKKRAGEELGLIAADESPLKVIVDGSVAAAVEKPKPETPPQKKAFIQDHNVMLRDACGGQAIKLSTDGTADDAYTGEMYWSPDRTRLVVMQVQPAEKHPVSFIESSPKDQLQPKLHTHEYLKAGDRIAHARPRLFDVTTTKAIPLHDDLFPNPWSIGDLQWAPDSHSFTFLYNQRGHQLLRLISVDAANGKARTVIEESSATFIDYSQKTYLRRIHPTNEAIWMSEHDGWNHLYLYDLNSGALKNAITHGEWVVRRVERIDEEKRQVWFFAMGIRAGQDPYHEHLCRVDFDGSHLVVLTEGDGTHQVNFSPNQKWFVDTFSRVDLPPITELRSSQDGHLVCVLENADASRLASAGWTTPERFTAKGRDGKTDICGVIFKPSNFDPAKKYPVIEQIYAGPHNYFVPKAWGLEIGPHKMAELGFIVVQIDGMGTNWRSRAFHDVAWRNLKDAGFPDRMAWMKAAAQSRPWMDLDRVGIYGGSAGGQNALAGLLHHGDFYKVGVADCGCHDNRMDKIWWNEAWLGWPVGPWYADDSNVTHAAKLTGKLMLVVGEMDTNVDPASTMQVVNALVKADKDFDLLVMPGTNHGAAETPYASRRRMDFLVRHLLGTEPRS